MHGPRILIFILSLGVTVGAQEGPATAAAFLEAARGASFGEPVGAGGLRIAVRELPLAARGAREFALAADGLEGDDRKIAAQLVRLRLDEDCFVFGKLLERGRYVIGLGARDGLPHWLIRDREGKVRAAMPYAVASFSSDPVAADVIDLDFVVSVDFIVGDQDLGFLALPSARHDAELGRMQVVRSGRVRLHGDRIDKDLLAMLAAELDRGLTVQARLLGGEIAPDEIFDLHLVADAERWLEIEATFGQGMLDSTYGFSTPETNRAYCDASILENEGLPADGFVPLILRHTLHHELHHVLAFRLRPEGEVLWPVWLTEGLADYAADLALEFANPGLGREQEALTLANMRAAIDTGCWPEPADLIGDAPDSDAVAWYGAARLLVTELDERQEGGMSVFLDTLRGAATSRDAEALLLRAIGTRFGHARALLDRLRERVLAAAPGPSVSAGYIDRFAGAHHVMAELDGALMILPSRHGSDDRFELKGSFAWDDETAWPVEFEFANHEGRHAIRSMSVVIGPDEIRLESWNEYEIEVLGTVALDPALESRRDGEMIWHEILIDFDRARGDLRVLIDGRQRAAVTIERYFPVLGGRIGVGLSAGSALFRLPVLVP